MPTNAYTGHKSVRITKMPSVPNPNARHAVMSAPLPKYQRTATAPPRVEAMPSMQDSNIVVRQVPLSSRSFQAVKQMTPAQQQEYLRIRADAEPQQKQHGNTEHPSDCCAPPRVHVRSTPNSLGPARYSVLLPGTEHILPTYQEAKAPVQSTSFANAEEGEYLCISPAPLNDSGVLFLPAGAVHNYITSQHQQYTPMPQWRGTPTMSQCQYQRSSSAVNWNRSTYIEQPSNVWSAPIPASRLKLASKGSMKWPASVGASAATTQYPTVNNAWNPNASMATAP